MKPAPFDYFAPTSVDEVRDLCTSGDHQCDLGRARRQDHAAAAAPDTHSGTDGGHSGSGVRETQK